MKIFIVPNYTKPAAIEFSRNVSETLTDLGFKVLCCNGVSTDHRLSSEDMQKLSECDIVIAIGGDGTTLRTAKDAAAFGLPVLGINAGHLGFMCGLEKSEIKELEKLANGQYSVEDRMMLNAKVFGADGELIYERNALNDAVISRGSQSRILDLDVKIGENASIHFRSDGIIVSTPTGSTAYALSAGGPVIDPVIECIQLTPVCSHSIFSRPVIFSSDTTLNISADITADKKIFLTVDGEKAIEIPEKGYIQIVRSNECARLIKMRNDSFYDVLKNKFKD